jgi:acyl carrier protein
MTHDEWKALVLRHLLKVAPDVSADELDPVVNFRDQFDFDSMDFLNFIISMCKELKIEIPEVDYPQLRCLDGCVDYLSLKAR